MPTNVNITVLLDADGKQLAAIKDSAKDLRKWLDEAAEKGFKWIALTGANGRDILLSENVFSQVAVINEVIVQQETAAPDPPRPKILVPELRPGAN